jgi:hypothetical protein
MEKAMTLEESADLEKGETTRRREETYVFVMAHIVSMNQLSFTHTHVFPLPHSHVPCPRILQFSGAHIFPR